MVEKKDQAVAGGGHNVFICQNTRAAQESAKKFGESAHSQVGGIAAVNVFNLP